MASCSRLLLNSVRLQSSSLINRNRFRISARGFHATLKMSEEQVEEFKKNPYYAKYADKIAKLQNTSPEEFLSRLSAHEQSKKDTAIVENKEFSLPGKPRAPGATAAPTKSLDKIMKLELLEDKTKEEITEIWTKHFQKKEAVCAVIPTETYNIMKEKFTEFNTFLFPLPRKGGYEFVMVQFQGNEAHFTTLINFQAHKENAPECFSMMHYTELGQSKGVVLMVGEYDKEVLTPGEAKCLADQVEIYYSRPSPERAELLRKFAKEPAFFNHNHLIEQMNHLAL